MKRETKRYKRPIRGTKKDENLAIPFIPFRITINEKRPITKPITILGTEKKLVNDLTIVLA